MKTYPTIQEDEVLLKVAACIVTVRNSTIMEHGFAGEVIETGKKITGMKRGSLVCAAPMKCSGLEEYALVRVNNCFELSDLAWFAADKMTAVEAGAFAAPAVAAYYTMFIKGSGFRPGGHVVIYGGGMTGLASIALARACGASKIIAVEEDESRRMLAKQMGADYVYNPSTLQSQGILLEDIILDITKGRCVTLQIESEDYETGMTYAGSKGRTANVRIVQDDLICAAEDDLDEMYLSVINLMVSGRIDLQKAVTSRISLNTIKKKNESIWDADSGIILVSQYYDMEI